ncbi:MAG: RNA polymerase sigma factor [Ignavibacteriae bacterium]|nr:RNA polymerase sigma factor [Ignavibacteria bacterium]MBI3364970.1 RNA polymerase sigma factor [Ignavibacteriota bacterium]
MAPKTDLELVDDFRRGHVEGFNELVRRYQEKVYWIARRVVGSHDDADDIVQDVFVRVYRGLKDFRSESGFYTWVYRITVNLSLNAIRTKRVKDFLRLDDVEEPAYDGNDGQPDSAILQDEYKAVLERAIDRLPPKQKLVFMMRYFDEIPYEEMAKILSKSVGGLKANYFHALKKIQEYVRRELNS